MNLEGDRVPSRPVVIVVAGGSEPQLQRDELPAADIVIAADSGFDRAMALGVPVDVLVGDLDSISAGGLAAATEGSVEIVRYPEAKDETDLEIALATAVANDPARVIVIGAAGGRLDHEIANLGVLAGHCAPNRVVELWTARERVIFAAGGTEVVVPAPVGSTISLLPVGSPTTGVTTFGLRWPLEDATLSPFRALGVSNVVVASGASVVTKQGVLAIVMNLTAS